MDKSAKTPIHLIVLHDTQNEAEPLLNLFRNSGHSVRPLFIASDDELKSCVEKESWDLVIARWATETVDVPWCIQEIKNSGKDLPVVVLIDPSDPEILETVLQSGVQDVVAEDAHQHLLFASLRELASLRARRKLRSAELSLRESERRVHLLLENSKDAIAYVHEGMHIYANQAYVEMFGYEESDDLLGILFMDLIEDSKQGELKRCLKTYAEGITEQLDCSVLHEDGSSFAVHAEFSGATYDGERCIQVVMSPDNMEAEEVRKQLEDATSRDLITGLYNRQYFSRHLDHLYDLAVSQQKNSVILYLRIMNFPALKSQLGIDGSEEILRSVAEKLGPVAGPDSHLARISEDAFGFCSDDLGAATELAGKITSALNDELFEVGGLTAQVQTVMGLSSVNERAGSGAAVMTRAHNASEQASRSGKAVLHLDITVADAADASDIGVRLELALENDGFKLLYQPIISLRGDSMEHYEVLLRMVSQEDGSLILPAEFMGAAHAAGLIARLDRWVVEHTVSELAAHRQNGNNTQVIVNITSASISDPTFLPWVNSCLKESRLPGGSVVFQISEEDAFSYLKPAKAFSKSLSVLKSHLSVAGFGHAQNSASLFTHLGISYVKVHPDYVGRLEDEEGAEKLQELISEVQQADARVIVPHIESAPVLAMLWQFGVNYIQGHMLQEPAEGMNYDFSEDAE